MTTARTVALGPGSARCHPLLPWGSGPGPSPSSCCFTGVGSVARGGPRKRVGGRAQVGGDRCPGEGRPRAPPSASAGQAGVLRASPGLGCADRRATPSPQPQDPGWAETHPQIWVAVRSAVFHQGLATRELEPGEARPHPELGPSGLACPRQPELGGTVAHSFQGRAGQVAPPFRARLHVPRDSLAGMPQACYEGHQEAPQRSTVLPRQGTPQRTLSL